MNAQAIAFWVLALLTPWIVQVIKVKLVWSGPKAKWLAMGISFVIAALAKTIAGELSLPNLQADPADVISGIVLLFGGIFMLATGLYTLLYEKLGLRAVA